MSNDRKDRVFLSYAKEDLATARKVYECLIVRGRKKWGRSCRTFIAF
jgi:hypothetical protein